MKHFPQLIPLAGAALALAACIGPFARPTPFNFDDKGDTVEFNYAWSAEASRSPALVKWLRADLERSFKAAAAAARADRAAAEAAGRTFRGHKVSRRWTTAGQSPRLLSLDGRISFVTGAAPPTQGVNALLWDRRTRSDIKANSLFDNETAIEQRLRVPFCAILAAEQAKRGDARTAGMASLSSCPPLSQVAIVPSDSDRDRRFDHVRLVAAPSVAGPYAEGVYDISVPVTATLLAAIKPAWRAEFEVGQPQ